MARTEAKYSSGILEAKERPIALEFLRYLDDKDLFQQLPMSSYCVLKSGQKSISRTNSCFSHESKQDTE